MKKQQLTANNNHNKLQTESFCLKGPTIKSNNQIETDLYSVWAKKNIDHQCAPMEQQKELRTINKPL